jgi:hypothetical protein
MKRRVILGDFDPDKFSAPGNESKRPPILQGRRARRGLVATSLIFPLPAPGSQPGRTPAKWDAARPFRGLGWREVQRTHDGMVFRLVSDLNPRELVVSADLLVPVN